jgi:hypothetical protein
MVYEDPEQQLRRLFVNAVKLRDPIRSSAIFVDCSRSYEGIVPIERMEALYRECYDQVTNEVPSET